MVRMLPWTFMGTLWVVWITALTVAFLHESCVGCTQLGILPCSSSLRSRSSASLS